MRIAPCGETGAPFPALDPLDTEATVKPAISEHASRWLRSHRIRRGAERGPAALALLLSGALAARFAPSPRLAPLLLTLSALAALGLFAWGLRRTWSSPAALLRRADKPWGDDLLQTGQAIEAGSAQGSKALQAAVLARARALAHDRSSGAVAPLRAPWAALGLCLALLSLHGMAGRRYGPAAAPALARSLEGGRMDGARPGQAALPARSPPSPDALAPVEAEPAARKRGAGGGSAGEEGPDDAGDAGGSDSRATPTADAPAEAGWDPLAGATGLWLPGSGGGAGQNGTLGSGRRDDTAGSAGPQAGGNLAAATDDKGLAASGDAPADGADASAARGDLDTVQQGEGPAEEGAEDAVSDEGAAPGEGGEEADDVEGEGDKAPIPPETRQGQDENLGKGESSAGRPGAGGANDASGSAAVAAMNAPPAWKVASEWVEGQWRAAPATLLRTIEEGRTGRRSSQEFQAVAAQYRAIAEAASTPEAVPPTRRAYLNRYFDALAAPEDPDAP